MADHSRNYKWGWLAAALAVGLLLCNALVPVAWAISPQTAAPRQAASGITLTGRAGFDGYYEVGQWTPIRVMVANDGPDVSGTLEMKVPHDNTETLYTRPVDLPTQSRRVVDPPPVGEDRIKIFRF